MMKENIIYFAQGTLCKVKMCSFLAVFLESPILSHFFKNYTLNKFNDVYKN